MGSPSRGDAGRAGGETPAAQGFRHPAEWEPHEATWLSWPRNRRDWPGKFGAIPWVYGEICRRIAPGERVLVLVESSSLEARARRVLSQAGVPLERVGFLECPTDRGWCRDMGPVFAVRGRPGQGEAAILRFGFNGWARYRDFRKDAEVPQAVAAFLGARTFESVEDGRAVVLEGGAFDVNGRGTILATEECLLDDRIQVRNPGFDRSDYEHIFANQLGAATVIWLGRGIAGDDTHGHVDDVCRFVDERTVVLPREPDPRDENHRILEENRERLEGARLEDGSRPEVVRLPMPAPLSFRGQRLPASYANFYVTNEALLVPTFNDPADRIALGTLAEVRPDRPAIGIHAVDLVLGLGAIHCLTHEQPRP